MNKMAPVYILAATLIFAFLLKQDAIRTSPAWLFILGLGAGVALTLAGASALQTLVKSAGEPRRDS